MASIKGPLICLLLIIAVSKPNPITINANQTNSNQKPIQTENSAKAEPKDPYRLYNLVKPEHYDIELIVPPDFETLGTFKGTVDITIQAETNNKDSISFHVDHNKLSVNSPSITLRDQVNTDIPIQTKKDEDHDMVTITPITDLSATNKYFLKVTFSGTLSNDIMYGFYRSTYRDENNKTQTIATTQFQPTHARKAFPCFDEPEYKATFKISLRHPKEYHALSNAEIEQVRPVSDTESITSFKTTPIMSTYLIAFLVSKYVGLKQYLENNVENSAWSPIETIDTAKYGMSVAPKILAAMKDFTGIDYKESGLKKLDQVSIPDFSAGAMENWGLVTYRETALHWDPNESSARNKQRVADVVGHELAHMWFGNLVTLKWWKSTWLNEGFARYFEYHATAKAEPTWELEKQFVIEQHQSILNSDSLSISKPLTLDASKPADVSARFSSVTYSKGGSVIRMMEHFLGPRNFQTGIKIYLALNKFKNTEPDDLWTALQNSNPNKNIDVKTIMDKWTLQGGFPLVTVSVKNNKIFLEQEHFTFDNPETPTGRLWYIPISYTTSGADKNFEDTAPKLWLNAKDMETNIDWNVKWLMINIKDTAYIRVRYDTTLWNGIKDALFKVDFDGIDPLNRAQLVDDSLNLARAGKITYQEALDAMFYLENELDYFPWYPAFKAFSYLRLRFDPASDTAKLINRCITQLMGKFYKNAVEVEKSATQISIHRKVLALTWGCELGFVDCVNSAAAQFNLLKSGIPVDPNQRATVYSTAIRHSTDETDWEFLFDILKTTNTATEVPTIITALGCSSNRAILDKYLTASITTGSGIRSQDAQSVFTAVIAGSPEGVTAGFEFLKSNHVEIAKHYGGMNALITVLTSLADRLTSKEQIDALQQFVNDNPGELAGAIDDANAAIENARANVDWAKTREAELLKYLQDKIGGGDGGNGDDDDDGGAASVVTSCVTLLFSILITFTNRW